MVNKGIYSSGMPKLSACARESGWSVGCGGTQGAAAKPLLLQSSSGLGRGRWFGGGKWVLGARRVARHTGHEAPWVLLPGWVCVIILLTHRDAGSCCPTSSRTGERAGGNKGLRQELQNSPAQGCTRQQKRPCQTKSSSNLIKIIANTDWSLKTKCCLFLLTSSVKPGTSGREAGESSLHKGNLGV